MTSFLAKLCSGICFTINYWNYKNKTISLSIIINFCKIRIYNTYQRHCRLNLYIRTNGINAKRGNAYNMRARTFSGANWVKPKMAVKYVKMRVILAPTLWHNRIVLFVLSIPKSGCKNMEPAKPRAKHEHVITAPIRAWEVAKCGLP